MLGQLLEVALVTEDTGEAWLQLQRLGFEPAATGDIWPHAYGVVACDGLAIGLHAAGEEPFSVVFVRPEVAVLHRELGALGVEVESARLGSDVFNELTLRGPDGIALRVLEARSFSPPARVPARASPGAFRWLSLPCRDVEAAMRFWSLLGAQCTPLQDPCEGFRVGPHALACHARSFCAAPLLVFDGPEGDAETSLVGAGFQMRPSLPQLADVPHLIARGLDLTLLMIHPQVNGPDVG
jgi:hypothetical protein